MLLPILLLSTAFSQDPGPAPEAAPEAAVEASAPVEAQVQGPVFPGETWERATPAEAGLNEAALDALLDYLFASNGDEVNRLGQRTNAFVLVKGGKIVVERYGRGTTADTPLLTWSVSKSFTNAIVGAAVQRGDLDIGLPAAHYLSALDHGKHADILVKHLLTMSSGLAWNETYEASPFTSTALAMLYGSGHADMAAYVARKGLDATPGQRWRYSSGDTNLLVATLRAALAERGQTEQGWADWPWQSLFDPIGLKHATWERDAAGNFVGSSYLYAPAVELARWAWLYRHDGVWGDQRLLPEGWVSMSTAVNAAYYSTPVNLEHYEDNPGAQLYANRGDPARGLPKPWPDLPDDAFGALGHWGKSIYVVPSWDMVVVRMGDDRTYACRYQGQEGCEPDASKAFSSPRYQEMLAAVMGSAGDGVAWSAPPRPDAPFQKGNPAASDLLKFRPAPSAYAAKETCSCRWVEGRDDAYCQAWAAQSAVPVKARAVDEDARTVSITALGVTSTARWVSAREGCALEG